MLDLSRADVSEVELSFRAPFGVVLRAFRKASGLTQAGLAPEVWRDHTYVSRWERGVLLPNVDELDWLVAALELREVEEQRLRDAWARSGDPPGSTGVEDLLVSLRAARTLRRLGEPRMAYELAVRDARQALRRARTARLAEPELYEVLAIAGELLLEEVKAALDFATSAEVRRGLLVVNGREHRLVRAALGDRRSRLRFGMAKEAVQYVVGEIEQAHRSAQALLDGLRVGVDDPEWLAEAVRAVAINSGLLGDDASLTAAWNRFSELEEVFPAELRRFALEGFVRGFTPLVPDRAFEIVEDAYSSLTEQGSVSVVRRVQLARSEGRLLVHVSGSVGDVQARRRVEDALTVSRALDLDKYVGELESLLGCGA